MKINLHLEIRLFKLQTLVQIVQQQRNFMRLMVLHLLNFFILEQHIQAQEFFQELMMEVVYIILLQMVYILLQQMQQVQ